MNRNYTYDPHYAYRPAGTPNLPIEEQLRVKFANRGLGAVSVNAARSAQLQPQPGQAYPRQSRPAQQRPVQQNRPAQNRPVQNRVPQNRPVQNRPVQPAAVPSRQTRAITESRPHVSQTIPLYETKGRRLPLPTAALVSLIVCTLTVLTLVMGSAMVSRAADEVSDLKSEAAALSNTERELSQALDRKNDLRTIERIAVDELGMIGTDLITKKYISFSGIDVIEAYDDEEGESVGLSTLLSAIGLGVK